MILGHKLYTIGTFTTLNQVPAPFAQLVQQVVLTSTVYSERQQPQSHLQDECADDNLAKCRAVHAEGIQALDHHAGG